MLSGEVRIFELEWGKSVGGLPCLIKRSDANAAALDKIVAARPWLGHLAVDRGIRSKTSVCLTVEGADADFIKKFAGLLDAEGAAHDIAGYRDAPPGLRIRSVERREGTGWVSPWRLRWSPDHYKKKQKKKKKK